MLDDRYRPLVRQLLDPDVVLHLPDGGWVRGHCITTVDVEGPSLVTLHLVCGTSVTLVLSSAPLDEWRVERLGWSEEVS